MTIVVDDSPLPEPVALLGAICRPIVVSAPSPEALAVLMAVLNDDVLASPFPEALAFLMCVWRIVAESPAVAPPSP